MTEGLYGYLIGVVLGFVSGIICALTWGLLPKKEK